MGGARPKRNLVVAGISHRRSDNHARHQRQEHCRNQNHQPARDNGGVGRRDGRAALQRNRMAGPTDCRTVRQIESRAQVWDYTQEDGFANRRKNHRSAQCFFSKTHHFKGNSLLVSKRLLSLWEFLKIKN